MIMPCKEVKRSQHWSIVFYPESAPSDYLDRLQKSIVPWALSPLHQPDADISKPHFHIVFKYSSLKSLEQVQSDFGWLRPKSDGSTDIYVMRVESIKGMIRYLIHADQPNKQQFSSPSDIVAHALDIDPYFSNSSDDSLRLVAEMCSYIRDFHVISFSKFVDIALSYNPDWVKFLMSRSAHIISDYIKSYRYDYLEECECFHD